MQMLSNLKLILKIKYCEAYSVSYNFNFYNM